MNSVLKTKRKQLGLSQYRLARMTGIGRHKLSLIECDYARPNDQEAKQINSVLVRAERKSRKIMKDRNVGGIIRG